MHSWIYQTIFISSCLLLKWQRQHHYLLEGDRHTRQCRLDDRVQRYSTMTDNPGLLCQHWYHAQEESSRDVTVYYSESYPLLPSRGRAGLIFKQSGEFIKQVIAPTCGLEDFPGTWQWQPNGHVFIQVSDEPMSHELIIISLTKQQLCLQAATWLLYRF